jgi:hypothetical protein
MPFNAMIGSHIHNVSRSSALIAFLRIVIMTLHGKQKGCVAGQLYCSVHVVLTCQQHLALLAQAHAAQALIGWLAIRLDGLGAWLVRSYGRHRGGALQQVRFCPSTV